jgi:hypothetical protein
MPHYCFFIDDQATSGLQIAGINIIITIIRQGA